MLSVTPLWASLAAVFYLWLAAQVIRARYRTRTALGSGGNAGLERAIRAHANFAEYVPLILVLLLMAELQGAAGWLLHLLGAVLLVGRMLHGFGISRTDEVLAFRSSGVILTFAVLVTAAALNLLLLVR